MKELESQINKVRQSLEAAAKSAEELHPQTYLKHLARIRAFDQLIKLFTMHIESIELERDEVIYKYNSLHADTQRLVKLVECYGINPNHVFKYPESFIDTIHKHNLNKMVNSTMLKANWDQLFFLWQWSEKVSSPEYLQFIQSVETKIQANG